MELNRNHQQARDLQAIVDHDFFLEFRAAVDKHDLVPIPAHIEHFGFFVLEGLEYDVVRLYKVAIAFLAKDPDTADEVPQITRRKDARVADRDHTIFHHTLAGAGHGRDGQVPLDVLARDDLVSAGVGEKLGPFLEPV